MAGARATGSYLFCLIFLVAVSSCYCSYEVQNKDDIMHHCRHYIEKNLGTADPKHECVCCQMVREANVTHICEEFTEEDRSKIELWKWAKVTRKCGNPLATGANCAGYIVPAPDLKS